MTPDRLAKTGEANARPEVGEGDHPTCTELERRKVGETPTGVPCVRQGQGPLAAGRYGVSP